MTNTKSSQSNIYDRRIKDVMSSDVVSLRANDTVHAALGLMGGESRFGAPSGGQGESMCGHPFHHGRAGRIRRRGAQIVAEEARGVNSYSTA